MKKLKYTKMYIKNYLCNTTQNVIAHCFSLYELWVKIHIKKKICIYFAFLMYKWTKSTVREIKTVYTDRFIPFIMFTFPKKIETYVW